MRAQSRSAFVTSPTYAQPLSFKCCRKFFCTPLRFTLEPEDSACASVPHMSSNDLLIVGAGSLGIRVAKLWQQLHPTARIVGETKTENSHARLRDTGITAVLAGSTTDSFPNVVFCVPFRGEPQFYSDMVEAAKMRASRRFVFTSSTSVYADAKCVTENTPAGSKGRAGWLAQAEEKTLQSPIAIVLRLSGLYHLKRGTHAFMLSKRVVHMSELSVLNLIHYDDAAAAVVCALDLASLPEKRTLLVAAPKEVNIRAIVECALKHPEFAGAQMPEFRKDGHSFERRVNGEWTYQVLGWRPTYPSIEAFMELDAERERLRAQ